jgi:hypothetical protein
MTNSDLSDLSSSTSRSFDEMSTATSTASIRFLERRRRDKLAKSERSLIEYPEAVDAVNTSRASVLNVVHLIKKSSNRHKANEDAIMKKLQDGMRNRQSALSELNLTKGLTGGQLKEAGTYHLNEERVLNEVLARKRKKTNKEIDAAMELYKKEMAIYTSGLIAMRGRKNKKTRSSDYYDLIKFKQLIYPKELRESIPFKVDDRALLWDKKYKKF